MAILATQRVLTLDHWKYARHLQAGDYVFNKEGKPVKVTLVQEYLAPACYEVTFNDHLTAVGDEHLSFMTENTKYRLRLIQYKQKYKFKRPLQLLSVKDLLELPFKNKYGRLIFSVPTAKPLEFPHKDLPVPPFVFGFWFFNTKSNNKMVFSAGMADYITEKFKDYGYKINIEKKYVDGKHYFSTTPSIESHLIPVIPTQIPQNYLLSSPEQRIELLQGILAAKSRQYSPKTNTFRVSSSHYGTILQIQGLAESLASRTKVENRPQINNYTIFFKSRHHLVPGQVIKPVKVHHDRRYITNIVPIQAQSCIHIETDGEDNTILVGEGFIPCL
jgi:hypothetical protein